MAQPLAASMPPDLDLDGNYTIRLTALDPNTGAVVPAVKVASLAMMVLTLGDTVPIDLAVGDFLLVPGPGA